MEKYQKIKLVGRGAHGAVHLCARKRDGQRVIVKQIPVDAMTPEERQAALGMFEYEGGKECLLCHCVINHPFQ